jgi:hypothetical protein
MDERLANAGIDDTLVQTTHKLTGHKISAVYLDEVNEAVLAKDARRAAVSRMALLCEEAGVRFRRASHALTRGDEVAARELLIGARQQFEKMEEVLS